MDAQTLLVTSNMALVIYIAKKYMNKGISFEDLVSAGNEGLVKAINMFDYINYSIEGFSEYIFTTIENYIKNEFREYNKHSKVLSFNDPIAYNKYGDDYKLSEIVGTDDEILFNDIINKMQISSVREALKTLSPMELKIIILRYGLDFQNRKTFTEIAHILGKSKSVISIQEKKALIKLRSFNSVVNLK